MGYLENFTLEDTISAYEKTMEVTGDNGEHCYSPVDEITLNFLKELKAYRDAEEQGLLLRLPCKVGDTVYAFLFTQDKPRYYECEVKNILIYEDSIEMCAWIKEEKLYARLDMAYIGKTVFLTKEAAEQKLASMQKGE